MSALTKFAAIAISTGLIVTATLADARPNRATVRGQNGAVTAVSGPNGSAVRARGARQNADGSVTAARGRAVSTANGRAARGSTTTVNPDGSAQRQSRAAASGVRGSASTQSNVSRSADGTLSGGRTTTATSNATGNSYNGSVQIDPVTGQPVRTATCTNASGATIACPR